MTELDPAAKEVLVAQNLVRFTLGEELTPEEREQIYSFYPQLRPGAVVASAVADQVLRDLPLGVLAAELGRRWERLAASGYQMTPLGDGEQAALIPLLRGGMLAESGLREDVRRLLLEIYPEATEALYYPERVEGLINAVEKMRREVTAPFVRTLPEAERALLDEAGEELQSAIRGLEQAALHIRASAALGQQC